MKIVLINAATLPIYRAELAQLLTDAVTHGASVGYDTQFPTKMPRATSIACAQHWPKESCYCGLPEMKAASLAPSN